MLKNVVAPTVLVILFWILSTIATAVYIRWLEAVPERMILEDLTTIHAADAIRRNLGEMSRALASGGRPTDHETEMSIRRIEAECRHHLDEAISTSLTAEEFAIDPILQARFEDFCAEVHRQMATAPHTAGEEADDLKSLLRLAGAVSAQAVKLGEVNERQMTELASSRAVSTSSLSLIRYGLLIIGPVSGIAFGFWISRRFHRSISQISITLDDVTSEFKQRVGRVDVNENEGLPRLQKQVNLVVDRIREVVDQLNTARRNAIEAARLAALGEMAAGVAHELRNPLTSVKLLIQTGAHSTDRTLTEKQFRVVLEEISRMETTIERMLDFARPPHPNRLHHDLRDILLHAISVNEGRAIHAHVVIKTGVPDSSVDVSADAEQLHQVFSNLLQNAIESMPGGGVLHVEIDRVSDTRCRVSVRDHGPGISADVMSRLFEPFVTDKARGTGLGLAVSRRIIQEHDGKLTAANLPGGGAEFTVDLPIEGPMIPLDSAHLPTESMSRERKSATAEARRSVLAHAQTAHY